MTTATPLARYGAPHGALARGVATAELHHHWGRHLVHSQLDARRHAELGCARRENVHKRYLIHVAGHNSAS
jgi:hypothetical protein